MKKCCENNINSVKLYDYYNTNNELAIAMELCDDSLQSILNKKKKMALIIRKYMI